MVNLLRRIFIKDYKNVSDKKVRQAHGKLAAFVGIFSNLILFVIKLFAGLISGSISIIADGINNLSDMGSSLITLLGFKLSMQPADKEHPFGHERMEYISSLIVSIIILFVGYEIFSQSLNKIINNELSKISYIVLIILGVSILIKILQAVFNYKIGKLINSIALTATACDSRNDVISTCVILIGSILMMVFPNLNFSLDGILGILVAVFILISGFKLVKESINPLLGDTPSKEFIKDIISDILKYPYVLGIHDPICHMYGPSKCFMTCHVEVPCDEDINLVHDVIDNIEREVGNKYGCLLTIHMDPIDNKSEEVVKLKEIMTKALFDINEKLSLHDFRVVVGPTHTNIIFDIVLPIDYKGDKDDIIKQLYSVLEFSNTKYYIVATFDYDYISG